MNDNEQKLREILALNIKIERARKQYTQETLAEYAGISTKHLTKIENAQVTTSVYFVYKIAKVLDISIDELLTEYKR